MVQQELDLSINANAEGAEAEHTDGDSKICAHCSKEFSPKSAKAIYCSQRCRNAGNMKKRKLNGVQNNATGDQPVKENNTDRDEDQDNDNRHAPASSTQLHGSVKQLDAQAQYIITHQRDMINDLKTIRSKLEDKVEKLTERAVAAEKKLDRFDLEKEFGIAEKSGLNGLSNNPLVQTLMQHFAPAIAPALGAWAEKKLGASTAAPGMEGIETLDAEAQENIKQLNQWYAKQTKDIQDSFFTLIESLSHLKDEEIPAKLKQLNALFTNGTTIPFRRAGSGGY